MNILNKYFDKIYYINLEKRKDRNQECVNELQKNNIIAKRFTAIDGKLIVNANWNYSLGALGCLQSHLEIIKEAKNNKYNSILILEDDVVFKDNLENNFKQYYAQLNKEWDILYLSGNYNKHIQNSFEKITDNIIKCNLTYTTHCYAIKNTIYDILIDILNKATKPIDVEYAKIQKNLNCYAFYPGISTQREGYSDIENKKINYKNIIK
jgi:GR25 family glycosyltransferase involved in LPS biosynthesis